ncbi:MAG: membrane-bound lytic murein transglycosylase MltF [Chromatiales bacterium]|nr:membrane-bound lytic murein transglycosylase MltF [Chromatiales bacterium]
MISRGVPLLFILLLSQLLQGCSDDRTRLQQVIDRGSLTVITRNSATTYYEGSDGSKGMEYDLIKGFADSLGVKVNLIVANNVAEALSMISEDEGDVVAAGTTITEQRKIWLNFTPPYQNVTQQLIYRQGEKRPKSVADLNGKLEVADKSSHEKRLHELHSQYRDLTWSVNKEMDSEDLIGLVNSGEIDYTITDSSTFQLNRHFYPELRAAFSLTKPKPLAWAFPKFQDPSLYKAAVNYTNKLKKDGTLSHLIDRYYGHANDFDYVGTRSYMEHIKTRLPKYRHLFEYAGKEFNVDWRLLAAMAYQESHWNPRAVSPTGVKGIMMLTQATAKYLGVKNRRDPVESIRGGASFYSKIWKKFSDRIELEDRTWLSVASYNIGYGHVEDTRIITQMRGGNPDIWKDIRKNLPLLRKKRWYKKTKHGYARGNEAVTYVENIRSYFDILVWISNKERKNKEHTKQQPPTISTPQAL